MENGRAMISRSSFICLLPLLGCGPGLAAAAQDAAPEAFDLGTMSIYGTPPTSVDLAAVTIPVQTIERLERPTLARALTLAPGVTLQRVGPRNELGVFVRGFDLRQVPLFLDGVPVYVPYDGYADLGRFLTFDVAEIQVFKGYSPVILGPNALGGAINVVSRQPSAPLEADARAGWFSGEGREFSGNVGGRRERWYFQTGAAYYAQETFPLSDDFEPRPAQGAGDRENARVQDWKASVKAAFTPNATDEYAVGFQHQEGMKDNPPYAGNDPTVRPRWWRWPEWDKQSVYFVSNTRLGETGYVKPRLYYDQFDNTLKAFDDDTYTTQDRPSSFTSIYEDYSWGASVEGGLDLGERHTLKAAFHYKFDHHDEHNVGFPHYVFEDQTFSGALEDTWRPAERWSVVPGVSYDVRDVLEAVDTNTGQPLGGDSFDSVNPQLGVFYDTGDAGQIHATVARKSRFPTIKDRYSYRLGQAIPNPDLEPETALHFELGWATPEWRGWSGQAAGFYSRVDDSIQRVDRVATAPNGSPLFQLQNVGEAEHVGCELELRYNLPDRLEGRASYAYLHRENLSRPDLYPTDTPDHVLQGYLDYRPVSWLSLIPSFEYNDKRYSTTEGLSVDSFITADFKVTVRLPRQFTLNAGVKNLLDANYELTEGYPEAGRTFFVNATWRY